MPNKIAQTASTLKTIASTAKTIKQPAAPTSGQSGLMSVTNFLSTMSSGLANSSRYIVEIPILMLPDLVRCTATAVELNGRNIEVTEVRPYTLKEHVPITAGAPETTSMTFIIDNDWKIYNAFKKWAAMVADPVNATIGYMSEYATDIKIMPLSVDGKIKKTFILESAFPTTIGPVQFSYGSKSLIPTFTVGFASFRHYSYEK